MKRICIVSFIMVLLSGMMFAAGTSEAGVEELRIGTASMGGAYYPVGQGIANLINDYAEGLTMVPLVTEGAVQNNRLLDSKDIEFGITNLGIGVDAYNGKGAYDKPLDVRGVAALYPSVLHMFTVEGTGVKTIADLKGKKVAVGPAGGGTISMLTAALEAYGLSFDDIVPSYLSYADGFSQLTDGNVDAAFALAGYPTSGVMQALATHDLVPIQFDDKTMSKILDAYPVYTSVTIPEDIYSIGMDIVFLGQMNVLITQADMDAAVVKEVLTAFFDNLPEFQKANNSAKQINRENAPKMGTLPLHPGAAEYYGK